jgi:hypothetical protein
MDIGLWPRGLSTSTRQLRGRQGRGCSILRPRAGAGQAKPGLPSSSNGQRSTRTARMVRRHAVQGRRRSAIERHSDAGASSTQADCHLEAGAGADSTTRRVEPCY